MVSKFDDYLICGTQHDLDGLENTDSFSYKTGEDIVFILKPKQSYSVEYTLYKDNAAENLYGDEKIIDAVRQSVKHATATGNTQIVTRMAKPGAVRLGCSLTDKNGEVILRFNIGAVADSDKIRQPMDKADLIPTGYTTSSGEKVEKSIKEFYDDMRTDFDSIFKKIKQKVEKERKAFNEFWYKEKNIGDSFCIPETVECRVVKTDESGVYVDFKLATDEGVGTVSTGDDGLFCSEIYKKRSTQTGRQQYNLRPSCGIISVPVPAAAGTLSMRGCYRGYGNVPAELVGTDADIAVSMNSHGILNMCGSDYYEKLDRVPLEDGGIGNCVVSLYEQALTDPRDLYTYGILMRDYVALQFAKLIPFYDGRGENLTVIGGSMAAWQSVCLSVLDKDVVKSRLNIPWMCSLGWEKAGDIPSGFMPAGTNAEYYYSTVCAARLLHGRTNYSTAITAGLADYDASPPSGVTALYNEFDCPKCIEFEQFKNHGQSACRNVIISRREQ